MEKKLSFTLQPLSHHRKPIATSSQSPRHMFRLAFHSLLPPIQTFAARTYHAPSTKSNYLHFLRILNARVKFQSIVLRTGILWSSLPHGCFPEHCNFNLFKLSILSPPYSHNIHSMPHSLWLITQKIHDKFWHNFLPWVTPDFCILKDITVLRRTSWAFKPRDRRLAAIKCKSLPRSCNQVGQHP